MLLVMVLICGGLVTYVAYNFHRWTAGWVRGPLVTMVDDLDLPAEQKISIKQNLNRVADAFQERRISYTQFTTIFEKLADGPFFDLVVVEAARHQYGVLHPQMDAEREETMLVLDRLARGISEGTIPREQLEKLRRLVQDLNEEQDDGSKAVTEAELKSFIDAARKVVEAANIPAEPFTPDFAAEIDKAVSTVIGPASIDRPATQTAPAAHVPSETMPE